MALLQTRRTSLGEPEEYEDAPGNPFWEEGAVWSVWPVAEVCKYLLEYFEYLLQYLLEYLGVWPTT